MRARIGMVSAWMALGLGCATTPRPERSTAAHPGPEPDLACTHSVERALIVTGLQEVAVRVTMTLSGGAKVSLLAPEMTPAQAEEVRRALAGCAWLPDPSGAQVATVTFGR